MSERGSLRSSSVGPKEGGPFHSHARGLPDPNNEREAKEAKRRSGEEDAVVLRARVRIVAVTEAD